MIILKWLKLENKGWKSKKMKSKLHMGLLINHFHIWRFEEASMMIFQNGHGQEAKQLVDRKSIKFCK